MRTEAPRAISDLTGPRDASKYRDGRRDSTLKVVREQIDNIFFWHKYIHKNHNSAVCRYLALSPRAQIVGSHCE